MQNIDVAHSFFYDINGKFEKRSMNVSYAYNKYWSYATVIAKITETLKGEMVCIISYNNFSSTTSKHIGQLKRTCPFNVVRLPQSLGYSDFYAHDTVECCIDNINYYAESKLTQKANREGFLTYYSMLKNTLEIVGFESQFEKTTEILNKYKSLYESINDPEKIKELKAKQKELERQRKENLQKELNKILEKYSYIDLIRFAYSDFWFNDFSLDAYNNQKELKIKLREYFNPKNELSFVWFDSDFCRTSQHITVNRKEAETLLKLWGKGKLKRGMKIACYTVLDIQKTFIKIGCHKIPVENLQALLNKENTKKAA